MRKQFGKVLSVLGMATFAVLSVNSVALAVDTMADWTGENTVMPTFAPNNNYSLISNTSVGGAVQSKINFSGEGFPLINEPHVYLSDPTLVDSMGMPLALDFTTPLHMEGTITFSEPFATEPNFFFGWYNSGDTRHRIGLGISNTTPPSEAGYLRMDLGYAASGGNKFYFATADGTTNQAGYNSRLPDGTYPFTFDYTPGPAGQAGGVMSATVGTYFKTVQPLETLPWDLDFFSLDRFGIVQRSTNVNTSANPPHAGDFDLDGDVDGADFVAWQTNFPLASGGTLAQGDADADGDVDGADFVVWQTNFPYTGFYNSNPFNVVFSNVTYTGGTAVGAGVSPVPEPQAIVLLAIGGVMALAHCTRRRR